MPGREALAGGIAMGVGSIGAVMLLAFGLIADRVGLPATLHVAAGLPVIAALLANVANAAQPARSPRGVGRRGPAAG